MESKQKVLSLQFLICQSNLPSLQLKWIWLLLLVTIFTKIVKNGATWGRFEPNTKIPKKKIKTFSILNFYLSFKPAPG